LAGIYHAGAWLKEKAKVLNVMQKPLENLLQGRDLIALGLTPSVAFKTILDDVYEQMLEGKLNTHEEALTYVKEKINAD
jgi:tRNA nucleotidyltransferase (CCA-adding enzyme)